jgi:predicted N-acetyltransferase YhbS
MASSAKIPVQDEVFMVAKHESGAIDKRTGLVGCTPAFGDL